MKRKRSRLEVSRQVYLNVTDIKDLLQISPYQARRVFQKADEIDAAELSAFRIEPRKVRTKTVCKLAQIKITELQAQIKSG
jgi:hypothetical protein